MLSAALVLSVVIVLATRTSAEARGHGVCKPPKFTYWGENGPDRWGELYGEANGGACDSAARQSPIALTFQQAEYSEALHAAHFELSDVSSDAELEVENDGLKAHLSYNKKVTLSGLGLNGTHVLDHIHMHWGDSNAKGSEHSLDGELYPAEIHLVFYKESFESIRKARKTTDGIAVLGVFLKAGKKNKAFDRWINSFGYSELDHCGVVDKMSAEYAEPDDFLPPTSRLNRFYRYFGSLTTPTCDEVVVWTVFADPIEVSNEQLAALRNAKYYAQDTSGQMVNNYRPLQPLAGRHVTRSFNDNAL